MISDIHLAEQSSTDRSAVCIIIPSLNPDQKLLDVVHDLSSNGYSNIILVNDGSSSDYDIFFQEAETAFHCHVLRHCVNQGKGRALKTAFNYFLQYFPRKVGVVTVDSDGQHQLADIEACVIDLLHNKNAGISKLTLGCRDFSGNDIPSRSKFGNTLTCHVFDALCGVKVSDTQTGLRAIPTELIPIFLQTKGERYEYEMNMLIDCKQNNIPISEVPIKTIYLEGNSSSHFNPLLDSVRIYAVFFKFIISSLSSFVIDIVLFTIFTLLLKSIFSLYYIIFSTILARIVSSAFNYLLNKHNVFQNSQDNPFAALKYYTLAVVQMICSAASVTVLHQVLPIANESILKIFVDTVLFLLSFKIQQNWVFSGKTKEAVTS